MPFILAVPASPRRRWALLPPFSLVLLACFLVGTSSAAAHYNYQRSNRGGGGGQHYFFGIGAVPRRTKHLNNAKYSEFTHCTLERSCCWVAADLRGGGRRGSKNGEDDDDEVAGVGAEDDCSSDDPPTGTTGVSPDSSNNSGDEEPPGNDAPVVGVKAHSSSSNGNGKKSNAVGDPDGEGSSDDDDDDDDEEDLSDWLEDVMGMMADDNGNDGNEQEMADAAGVMEHMHVAVEYVSEDGNNEQEDDDDDNEEEEETGKRSRTSGGVGIRLGQRFKNHRQASSSSSSNNNRNGKHSNKSAPETAERHWLSAWQPHVYLPPPPGSTYLKEHARALDGDGKARLDRRTLYAGLLLEWSSPSRTSSSSGGSGGSSGTAHAHPTTRKFLEKDTSQALQAALSLATQPAWRKSFPRPSGIRLYNGEDAAAVQGCTLAMQESIAMALAHSLGAGLVMLDDNILSSIRQQLLRSGYTEEDVKPASLIKSVLSLAREGSLLSTGSSATISDCMRSDLGAGLDDPFDERASASCEEMAKWEQSWHSKGPEETSIDSSKPLPLVIFLRTQGSTSLLKSKSAVDVLLSECNSKDSINFLVLGKGIDASTDSLPVEREMHDARQREMPQQTMHSQALPGAAPWFGFTPHNQNASGQNDPEGSRRFNIFLARTVDPNGTPGIVGAVAPPEAGNLFPHMMAMQARMQLQQHDEDSPAKAELERWAQMLQQQMQTNGGMPLPPPQFFNASFTSSPDSDDGPQNLPQLSPELIQQTLEHAMSELLDRLAQLNEDGATSSDLSPDMQRAFAQVLRNENLRNGIQENLARAAPALSDPKCQGVLLSVFVPPPPHHMNHGKLPGQGKTMPNNMSGWFQKMLSNQEESDMGKEQTEENRRKSKQKRVRTMAAAAAVKAAQDANEGKNENKAERNLVKLEAVCRPVVVKTPSDPVRAKSWEAWIARERGAVIFRQNRRVLNDELEKHFLSLQEHTGTRGAGSSLRQMLSVRLIKEEMSDVIKRAIEFEAAKSQRQHETPDEMHTNEMGLDVDITLSQLLLTEDGLVATEEILDVVKRKEERPGVQYLHPSSLEAALSSVCSISPSPAGGLSVASTPVYHRSREEISALAQDKHERALVSQVVSPQDIGVTYDMIGGLSDVKELLRQSITYPLKFPHLYSEGIAREAVKGVLLFGPPGTGKTMLAKAVATEGGASFLSVDASSVENKWLGESEKNAKAVFTLARRLAPCVIFIDEVDSLLSSREGTSDDSAHGTLTSVKTTMMSEWDGLNSGTNGSGEAGSDRVVVIGSTNRPFDLDEAVLRRFPRRILVDLPDLETRKEVLEVTLAENRLDPGVNLTAIAERLEGYTGSDIKEVCREAVVQISHEQAKLLDQGFSDTRKDVTEGSLQRLRPVTSKDFEKALSKLKRSVSEKGKELARVWEWNDEYGEIKKTKNSLPHLANMYL